MTKKKSSFGKIIILVIFVLLAAAAFLNRTWIVDFYHGTLYRPTAEVIMIRDGLDLTNRGEFLFNASRPVLNSEEEFNFNCQSLDEKDAILGCYTNHQIYVYNITESRLKGIRELTTAHELLHAVYGRMPEGERDALRVDLEKVFRENQDILKEEIEIYDSEDQLEEIYVRAGTEIKKLPESLEKHFAEIFKDQDKIVDFYNSYIKVFRELEEELDKLKTEMDDLDSRISAKTDEYERRVAQFNSEVERFNACADTAGCFSSEYEFTIQRNQLVSEQDALNALYNEIDGMINQYNANVEKYNSNVIESNNLQNIINSHVKVEGV